VEIFLYVWLGACVIAAAALFILRPGRHVAWLAFIILLAAFAGWVSLPSNPGIHIDLNGDGQPDINLPLKFREGLDLAGGVQVLLSADLPPGQTPPAGAMDEVRRIVENRIDSLGALEPVVQQQGEGRIIVELPGYENPEAAVSLIRQTAQLEFVEVPQPIPQGTKILTTYEQQRQAAQATGPTATPEPGVTPEATVTAEPTPTADATAQAAGTPAAGLTPDTSGTPQGPVYKTVMTGEIIQTADVQIDRTTGSPLVQFTLTPDGAKQFGDYTSAHVGDYLAIVLDGVVVSSPQIQTAITGGQGSITGKFTLEEATTLATQLRYGALPIALKVESTSTVGPTLGQISVQESIRAGLIGIGVVLLFMLVYYRIPGISAALALIVFALLNLMIFKLVPVTMTLPAITGFLISVGTAVDGNILIFERLKEELRLGKTIDKAILAGFDRAWTSIRDSNLSTLIICAILYGFGTSFGAGAVRGFAVTLALGLLLNLFTAITVTRTFLHFIMLPLDNEMLANRKWLLGL
jgi:protein-export membrane protein SecD